jgi:hypothetical protein
MDGRSSELATCPAAGGQHLQRLASTQRFFRQSQTRSYRCPKGSVVQPPRPKNGESNRFTCTEGDSTIQLTVSVVNAEAVVEVQGKATPCVELDIRAKLAGEASGTTHDRRWLTANGTLLRWESQTDVTTTTSAGRARYTEQLVMQLTDLAPRQ